MDEGADPLKANTDAHKSMHREIIGLMILVVLAGASLGFLWQGTRFGVGVLFGGLLAFTNYIWLERSTRFTLNKRAASTTGWLAVKYVLRHVAIGAVLLAIYLVGLLPIIAVLAGLGAFALAVTIKGLRDIFKS